MFTRAVSAVYLLSSVWVCHTIFSSPKRDDTISVVLLSITIAAIIAQEIFTTRKQPYTRPSASSGLIDGTILVPLLLASFKPIIENDFSTKILSDLFWISSLNSVHLLLAFSGWIEKSPFRIYATIAVELIFCIYVSLFSDSIPAFLIALVLYFTTHKALLSKIKNTFTVGEASIVANSTSLLAYFIWIISFERQKFDLQSYYFQHNVIVLALIGGTILICMITIPFLQHSKSPSSDIPSKGVSYSVYFYVATIGTIFGIVAPWVMYIIGSHPVIWIFEDLQHVNNYLLFAYWIVCLVFLLPIIGWVQRTGVKNIVVRKCFHLLGLIMFVPATWLSPRFLSLGYAVAFAALLILELIKFGNVPPFGPGLTKFMGTFIDSRDTGYFTVTHMYLLIGCAAPLWLVSTLGWGNTSVSSFLPVYSGLLTLGVGDSAAAVIGTFYGRSKWPWPAGSSRSFEGTAANIVSVLFSILFLSLFLNTELNWIGLFVAVTLSACLEAITDQIDNITLPILFIALLNSSSVLTHMKFFAKQKVDAIGITSVSLQKILLFLMILSIFTLFNGGLFSFFLCLVGFLGAYRRHTGMLSAYVIISVLIIVLCFFAAFAGMFMMSNGGYYDYDYSSEYIDSSSSVSSSSAEFLSSSSDFSSSSLSSSSSINPERPRMMLQQLVRKVSSFVGAGSQSSESSSHEIIEESSESSYSSYGSFDYSYSDDDLTGIIFFSVVVLVIGFFIAYLKVYSIVLAWRMRKMILTERLSPLPTKDTNVHEFAPANTSCAVDVETPAAPVAPFQPAAPMFAPGFAPYPYGMPMMYPPHMQGQQFQNPHHMMFGQQPVFYTYAPVEQPENEKL